MHFNERTHAYLAASFYGHMKERFGERAVPAYIHAVQYYAGQRGRRMAQRAIRDGVALTHAAFLQYGELATTDLVSSSDKEIVSLSPDYEVHIRKCPWHDQFVEMGAQEAGSIYCRYLDEALCRGFNPDLVYQAPMNLNIGSFCLQRVLNTRYESVPDDPPKKEYRQDFSYHCGNLYFSFAEFLERQGRKQPEMC